ncbi:hypothetical protein PENSTE_c031G04140 [Penicillium steckii]|uniref:D-xylose reductase [NAD(P)H] n=1 Tax=Penicillium steckii TaxID=303698 RepID=A0A1V6SMI0_9EURO|nr:hypothetical protein PENSTE_c031G04140 [Penicillium steckii]
MSLPSTFLMRAPGGRYVKVPSVGFGTWAAEDPSWCTQAVADALQMGVRHLDCAWEYGVDKQVGEGIRLSGVPRDEVFITSKFWPNFAGPENVSIAIDKILDAMGLEYLDLFLAHFPAAIKPWGDLEGAINFTGARPCDQRCAEDQNGNYVPDLLHCPGAVAALNGLPGVGSFVPTWEAMKAVVRTGKCRAIGVSNFERVHLEEILPYSSHSDIPISCNQIEAHPWHPNDDIVDFLHDKGILPTIYSPFAPKTFMVKDGMVQGLEFAPDGIALLEEPIVRAIASKNGMDVGQVLQSWAVQRGTVPLAKSRNKARIASNLSIRRLPEEDFLLLNSLKKPNLSGKSIDVNLLFPGVRLR